MVDKIIGVTELQRKFSTVFDEVVQDHTRFVLTRGSRPEAAIIPYEEYVKFIQAREAEVLSRLDETLARMAEHNAKYTDEEVERDVEEVSKIVRARRRLREQKQAYRPTKTKAVRTSKTKR